MNIYSYPLHTKQWMENMNKKLQISGQFGHTRQKKRNYLHQSIVIMIWMDNSWHTLTKIEYCYSKFHVKYVYTENGLEIKK